jgi:hypothetical protein
MATRCPVCGSLLQPVTEGDRVNHRCTGCERCWSTDLGVASLVDPATCVSCAYQSACLEALRRRSP